MISNQEIVFVYEAVAGLTEQMVAAARTGDWAALERLESECAAHVQKIRHDRAPSETLSNAMRLRKWHSIKKILSDDRKIRDLAMPWSARLSSLLTGRMPDPTRSAGWSPNRSS